MRRFRIRFELPLLAKELNELAARRRTYIVRFIYAAALFSIGCGLIYSGLFRPQPGVGGLGSGYYMFEQLVLVQFAGICLLLPATASGSLTGEKERDALCLLLITTLGPWQIVLQKFISQLVPIVSFLLLSFPLMAVTYSFGGVTPSHFWAGISVLVLSCLQITALAVMCSSYFRTTAEAFVATYVLLGLLMFVFPWLSAPTLMKIAAARGYAAIIPHECAMIGTTAVFLILALGCLVPRAFAPPRHFLLQAFRALDEFFNNANSLTGGVVLVDDKDTLPRDKPIAWRETKKRSLGTFRYLFRVVTLLELPILFVCQSIRIDVGLTGHNALSALLYASWIIVAGLLAVQGTSAISAERSRQTLDVLLTTPISGREIIQQKFRGLLRTILVLSIPFYTIYVFEDWWFNFGSWRYLSYSALSVVVYMPLIAWLSVWIGLKIRTHIRAIFCAMLVLVGTLAVPLFVRQALASRNTFAAELANAYAVVFSPSSVIRGIEASRDDVKEPWVLFGVHLAVCAGIAIALRWLCLRNADRQLGRIPERSDSMPTAGAADAVPAFVRESAMGAAASGPR